MSRVPAPGRRLGCLVEVSARIGAGGEGLEAALEEAARACGEGTLTPGELEEALLQSYLFVGFPAALAAMSAWRERIGRGPAKDPTDPLAPVERAADREARGEEVCRTIYGPLYEKLRANVRRLHPDLDRWMIREGYGKVLGRPGLGLADRELCNVALLAAAARGPQLHSHLRGALRAGAGPDAVERALGAGLSRLEDADRRASLEALWRRVQRSVDAAEEA